jgi:hypothetical protein
MVPQIHACLRQADREAITEIVHISLPKPGESR